jgi:hypothetical protein
VVFPYSRQGLSYSCIPALLGPRPDPPPIPKHAALASVPNSALERGRSDVSSSRLAASRSTKPRIGASAQLENPGDFSVILHGFRRGIHFNSRHNSIDALKNR